ncbi:thioredoxin [Pelagibacteraceae bacterium]|nr:thioredoxin [Pelagibacteraceae bacterium]
MIEESYIIDVKEDDFNTKVIEESNNKLVIVDFWAPWCGPCKQLTPILEKVTNDAKGRFILAKINIDENQQIAAQLRIQSIPTVYAFKDKQIVNAFQGVIPEKKIVEFVEKSLGSKINQDHTEFYNNIKNEIKEKRIEQSKEVLINFISDNPKELIAINLYLECLIELKQFEEVENFLDSLEDDIKKEEEIKQIVKKLEIIKNNMSGPDIENLMLKLEKKPDDISLIIEISDKYFSMQNYDESLDLLLRNYTKNKDLIKKKMVEYFEVLGDKSEYTILYRKKLSQLMFS